MVVPVRPWTDLRGLFELVALLRREKPDVVSAHSSKAGILGRIAGRLCGVPTIHTAHGWAFNKAVPGAERYRIAERMEALVERFGVTEPGLPHALCDEHMRLLRLVAVQQPHHRESLADLATRLRIGVCSNFSHTPTALGLLEEAGLRDSIHAVVISETNGYRKPRPEIFADVLEQLGTDPPTRST